MYNASGRRQRHVQRFQKRSSRSRRVHGACAVLLWAASCLHLHDSVAFARTTAAISGAASPLVHFAPVALLLCRERRETLHEWERGGVCAGGCSWPWRCCNLRLVVWRTQRVWTVMISGRPLRTARPERVLIGEEEWEKLDTRFCFVAPSFKCRSPGQRGDVINIYPSFVVSRPSVREERRCDRGAYFPRVFPSAGSVSVSASAATKRRPDASTGTDLMPRCPVGEGGARRRRRHCLAKTRPGGRAYQSSAPIQDTSTARIRTAAPHARAAAPPPDVGRTPPGRAHCNVDAPAGLPRWGKHASRSAAVVQKMEVGQPDAVRRTCPIQPRPSPCPSLRCRPRRSRARPGRPRVLRDALAGQPCAPRSLLGVLRRGYLARRTLDARCTVAMRWGCMFNLLQWNIRASQSPGGVAGAHRAISPAVRATHLWASRTRWVHGGAPAGVRVFRGPRQATLRLARAW